MLSRITLLSFVAFPLLGCLTQPNTEPNVDVSLGNKQDQEMQVESYLEYLRDFGQLSWVVLFVESDFENTARKYGELVGQELNPAEETPATADLFDPSGTVVELHHTRWVVVFHSVGVFESLDTAELAKHLGCRIVEFSAEDTAGVVDLQVFAADGSHQRYLTKDDVANENELNEEMGLPQVEGHNEIETYDAFFDRLGIKTVNLYISQPGSFCLPDAQSPSVGRVFYRSIDW